jgi:uncharacterized protein with PIN domain
MAYWKGMFWRRIAQIVPQRLAADNPAVAAS